MRTPHSPLFILADGAHARFVVREPKTRSFVVLKEVDGSGRLKGLRRDLRGSPPARSQESSSPSRHSVGREDHFRQAKEEAFVADVADLALEFENEARDGVVIVAPARLLGPLRRRLEKRMRVVGALSKDLVKTPESELGEWLSSLAFSTPAS